jgi:hypothetical protein
LFEWLQSAEDVKGSALTATEVAPIRDGAPAVVLAACQMKALIESRAIRAVAPLSAYESRERLKAERTGSDGERLVDGLATQTECLAGRKYV